MNVLKQFTQLADRCFFLIVKKERVNQIRNCMWKKEQEMLVLIRDYIHKCSIKNVPDFLSSSCVLSYDKKNQLRAVFAVFWCR